MRSPAWLGLTVLLGACAPAPFLVLQFPDAQAEAEAAELTVYALRDGTPCGPVMKTGSPADWLLTVTAPLPLSESVHLGRLARGPTVFFAEVRDAAGAPFLRACSAASSGAEVLLQLRHVLRPVRMREGEQRVIDVIANDAQGQPAALALGDAPRFASWDAAARTVRLMPGPADQGTYVFSVEPTEPDTAFAQQLSVVVEDMPRPLKWDRIYRGWVGRFDAAALWDPEHQQLLVTGGRDQGIELAKPSKTLFVGSKPPDALTDFRVLAFAGPDGGAPDWSSRSFTRPGTSGKYGHVMGWVRTPLGERLGFIIGGSDGAQISAESLLFKPGRPVTAAMVPGGLTDVGGKSFRFGMAAAAEPDFSSTYLFGGDLGQSGATPDLLQVVASNETVLEVVRLSASVLPRPLPRSNATLTLALDPRRLVVIGGHSVTSPSSEVLFDDAWVICLEESAPKCPPGSRLQWLRVTNPGGDVFPGSNTAGVFGHVAGYDAVNDRVITYGGLGVANQLPWLFEDVFALELATATPTDAGLLPARFRHLPPPGGPYGLVAAAAAQDTDGGRLLLYGGVTGRILDGTPQLDLTEDVWALGLTPGNERLTKLTTTPEYVVPARRVGASIVTRGPLILGGQGEGADPARWPADHWRIEPDGGAVRQAVSGTSPLPRANMSVAYNPDLDEHWLYGGRSGSLLPLTSLFRYRADGGYTELPQDDVNPRWGQGAVWDELNHRMLCFGGIGLDVASGMTQPLNDVLAIRLQGDALVTETIAAQGAPPPPRYGAIVGYDRHAQRLLVFGGTARIGTGEEDTVDVWELSLTPGQERWRQIQTRGAATDLPESIYFPAGAWTQENPPRLYVIGTVRRQGGTYAFIDGLWRLELDAQPTWVKQMLPDFAPRPRVFPAYAFDEREQKIYLSGGAADPVFRNDVWTLTLP